jgi:hypothetical protein
MDAQVVRQTNYSSVAAIQVPPAGIFGVANLQGTFVQVNPDGTTSPLGGGIGMPGYLASNYGISTSNVDNGPALNTLLATIRASGRGGRIYFDSGIFPYRTTIVDTSFGTGGYAVELIGAGRGGTYFSADDSLGNIGPLISLTKSRYFHVFDATLSALTQRTASPLVKITGDSLIGSIPSVRLENSCFIRVDLENGFDGYQLIDGPGNLGACGIWIEGPGMCRNFAAGGTVFDINTPNGTVINIDRISHQETAGVAGAARPYATMRIRGAGDSRFSRVESIYARNGLIVDPPAGGNASAMWFDSCIFGSVTDTCMAFRPDNAAMCILNKLENCWVDSDAVNAKGLEVVGAANKGFQCDNLTSLALFRHVILNGVTDTAKIDATMSGGTLGFYATGSSRNFQAVIRIAKTFGISMTASWQVDAGCDRYDVHCVGGFDNSNTPVPTDNGGPNKSVVTF